MTLTKKIIKKLKSGTWYPFYNTFYEKTPVDTSENYTTVTKEYILNKIKQDKTVLAISAATPGAYGFTPDYRAKLGKNYTDVGIAEEHAILRHDKREPALGRRKCNSCGD